VSIHPKNKDIYFTDTIYGYVQDFRPAPGLQDQVYRFNPDTGAVTVVADEFDHPNGANTCLLILFHHYCQLTLSQASLSLQTVTMHTSPIPELTAAFSVSILPGRQLCMYSPMPVLGLPLIRIIPQLPI
jgi:hypothetical protein